ncbi:protein yippee-like moh1 [Pestalotiopsis sp. IQ-011]
MGGDEFKTPKRPKYRVSKPQQRGDHAQPWTASRGQRLLRPLLSRIALLRKSVANQPCPDALSQSLPSPPRATEATETCAWLAPRKKLRRTYSQRSTGSLVADEPQPAPVKFKAAKDLQRESQSGEIVAFTPLLRRVRGHQMSSPVQAPESAGKDRIYSDNRVCRHDAKLEERLASLRAHVSPARYADYEAIFRNTEALLNVVSQKPSRRGASSLLDMCLRKVPQYIAGVEAWEVHEAELNGTRTNTTGAHVGPHVYTELESLGASDSGWIHLRTATEAEALNAIAAAMAEGLFPDELSMILIELCSNYGVKQLDELLDILINRQYPPPLNMDSRFSESPTLRPLAFLSEISARTGRSTVMLQHISGLLARGSLHYTWLATREFKEIWGSAFEAISKGRAALDAVDFLATSVILLCKNRQLNLEPRRPDRLTEPSASCQQQHVTTLAILAAMRRSSQDELFAGKSHNSVKIARLGRLGLPSDLLEDIKKSGAFTLAEQSNDLRDLLYAESLVSGSVPAGNALYQGSRKRTLFEGFRWDSSISEWVTASPTMEKKAQRNKTLRSSLRAVNDRISDPFVDGTVPSPSRSTGPTSQVQTSTDNTRISDQRKVTSRHSLPGFMISRGTPLPRHQKQKKRYSDSHAAGTMIFSDELCDDKENHGEGVKRKRHSSEVRKPLVRKRRVRLSGGVHSDDELGV